MSKFKYQNTTEFDLELMGHGLVKAGDTITTLTPVENPNFKYVGEAQDEQTTNNQPIIAIQEPQANAVTEAELITPNEETK